ncbi:MAG: hypothetical protein K2P10_03350 [Oscillospiraceae bacterium]|nr:hypothetical protein [Oscillospiraceae bacterium]
MKIIDTRGITYIEPLDGSCEWYWGSDYAAGDLYEAEELYRDQHPVTCNRLVFVHYPDGRTVEPIEGKEGQYFGRPISYDGKIQILLANFPKSSLHILQYDDTADEVTQIVSLPLAAVEDCYNLLLRRAPLMLTRQANNGKLQIIWPEKAEFDIGETESFLCRKDNKLYFCLWHEDPDYREEIIVRKYPTGEVTEVIPGAWKDMPDGQIWVLQ